MIEHIFAGIGAFAFSVAVALGLAWLILRDLKPGDMP